MMSDSKRKRAANFTPSEVRLLLNLAIMQKGIIENKKTDSETWKIKDQTWENIAIDFNASSGKITRSTIVIKAGCLQKLILTIAFLGETFRTVDTLRQKYDGLKKGLKKKVIKNKQETQKTGGGIPDYIKIEGPEKDLLQVLSLSVHGLSAVCDSDTVLPPTSK